jgi:hypothetical protein
MSLSTPAICLVVAVGVLGWALNHPYMGLFHDSRLYVLQALSRLSPDSLARDVFLRYGSQDQYTLFSVPLAGLIRLIGTENAAAALTAASQLALLAGAWLLARRVASRPLALLGVVVLIVAPTNFGFSRTFMVIEPFMTPRMSAEALVLAGLAAALAGRSWLAIVLVIAATLCHPLMAMAGAVALACWYVAIPRPRLFAALALGGGVAVTASALLPVGPLASFDPHWLALLRLRSPMLFLLNWTSADWARLAPTFSTLVVGAICLPQLRGRQLCAAVLVTLVCALLLTATACDWLHLVLFTQLQPWRWLWLGCALSAIVLPAIVHARWNEGRAARPTVLLLLAVWIFGDFDGCLLIAVLTVASLWFMNGRTAGQIRLLWIGSCGIVLLALIWCIASNLELTRVSLLDSRLPYRIRVVMSVVSDGVLWLALIALICRADTWGLAPRYAVWLLLTGAALTASVVLIPATVSRWAHREYTAADFTALAPFRAKIPAGTDVFWDGPGMAAWILLERPNYLLPADTSGMLFSRAAAIEMERRANSLSGDIPPGAFLDFEAPPELLVSAQQLQGICRTGRISFIITRKELSMEPVSAVQLGTGHANAALKLYSCQPAA